MTVILLIGLACGPVDYGPVDGQRTISELAEMAARKTDIKLGLAPKYECKVVTVATTSPY